MSEVSVERCRNCKHIKTLHATDSGGSYCCRGWLYNLNETPLPHCYCPGYEPLDNLEYLEMRVTDKEEHE